MDEEDRVQRYIIAATAGREAEARGWLAQLLEDSPVRVAPQLLRWLVDPRPVTVRAACAAAVEVVSQARTRSLWAVDRALRERSEWLLGGVRRERLAQLARGAEGLGALTLLSMQRNGYTRQDAVSGLVGRSEPLVLRLLLLRLNDPVPLVAAAARDVLWSWLEPRRSSALAEVLPLLASMHHTVRAAHSGFAERADALLERATPALREALRRAIERSRDEDVRAAAVLRLARGAFEDAAFALHRGLSDHDPRVRHMVARWMERASLSPELRHAVLPALHDNPSPRLRLLSLRLRRGDDSDSTREALLQRCFDGNAVVRYHARRMLRSRGDESDFYALAQQRLAATDSSPRELVGVLAVLSDIGRRADIERVRPFLRHPVRRVAAEAERTLGILEQG